MLFFRAEKRPPDQGHRPLFSSGLVLLLLYSGAGSRLLLIAGVMTYQMDADPLTKTIFISFLSVFPLIFFSTVLTLALCAVLKLKHLTLPFFLLAC